MKRAALIAAVSVVALSCAGPSEVSAAWDANVWWGSVPFEPAPKRSFKPRPRPAERNFQRDEAKSDTTPPIPSGLLHIIVSIDKQRATLFADGVPVASTAISSGTPSHPTPTGVFTVIQKSRHHVSNLYNASMPYMQRITWSGAALHQGPLPGYPASHGCVRLPESFAQLLWKATKMGARVIVTEPDVAPLVFDHVRLFVPRSKTVESPKLAGPSRMASASPEPATTAAAAIASEPKTSEAPPVETPAAPAPIMVDERPKTMPAAIVQEANRRPISVFASLKERKLYVRQGWKPLFEAPVSFKNPDQPVGTHVYTAMGMKADGNALRWTVVSIPSGGKRIAELKDQGRKSRNGRDASKAIEAETPLPSPSAALDRIVMPPDLVERISELMTPGSSLIVSDNKLSDETGEYTGFIVLTR